MNSVIFVCEYYARGQWIRYYFDKDKKRCMEMDSDVFGSERRIAKYEYNGKNWKFLEVVN